MKFKFCRIHINVTKYDVTLPQKGYATVWRCFLLLGQKFIRPTAIKAAEVLGK